MYSDQPISTPAIGTGLRVFAVYELDSIVKASLSIRFSLLSIFIYFIASLTPGCDGANFTVPFSARK